MILLHHEKIYKKKVSFTEMSTMSTYINGRALTEILKHLLLLKGHLHVTVYRILQNTIVQKVDVTTSSTTKKRLHKF